MCGEPVTWRKNASDTLSYFCQDCDFQGYAKAGTRARALATEEMEKFATRSAQAPAKPAAPVPPAALPAKPAALPAKPARPGLLLG